MRHTSLFLAMLLAATLVCTGVAQEKALTAKEAKAAFETADRDLNAAWAAAKKALSEAEFNVLKEEQRAWVQYRDYLARSPLYTGADVQGELALDAPEYLEAATGLAELRTRWLQTLIRTAKDDTLTGVWTDSYGGHIEIVEREGHLHFVMECVRGPTFRTGGLAGIAVWNQPIGWFSDRGREDGKEDETNLSFNLRGRKLEVIGANTGYYHGAYANFDGAYVKVQALNTKAQAKIVKAAKLGEVPEQ